MIRPLTALIPRTILTNHDRDNHNNDDDDDDASM